VPHGSIRVGDVDLFALCDADIEDTDPIEAAFPMVPAEAWDELRAAYPETVAPSGRWRLHVHCYVLRSAAWTVLVDTGIGPETAPAFAWSATAGRLRHELAMVGVDPAEVGYVMITHVHDDHIGWNVAPGTTDPMFPNAEYVVNRADWEALRDSPDEANRAIFEAVLAPLEPSGLLRLSEGEMRINQELVVLHAPGHTPGHQVVLLDSHDERAIIVGDTANHPCQVAQPTWSGASDADPEGAARTRAELLERIEREGRLVATAHFPEPFGHVETEDGTRSWVPTSPS
jgi:glyoxylase-like metal-dependent hydrolase (beta-lactamase superfamily II)